MKMRYIVFLGNDVCVECEVLFVYKYRLTTNHDIRPNTSSTINLLL
jgi:hypothetical protein